MDRDEARQPESSRQPAQGVTERTRDGMLDGDTAVASWLDSSTTATS